jgi:hypothetical protein
MLAEMINPTRIISQNTEARIANSKKASWYLVEDTKYILEKTIIPIIR